MKLTTNINELWYKRYNTIDRSWYIYLFFAVLRIALVFVPQWGNVHPDEFFQTLEIVNGDHFHLEHIRPWEYNNTMPIRSITLQLLLLRVPFSFVEFASIYIKYYLAVDILNGYTYLVLPRLIYSLLSFGNDWAMYKTCRLYGLKFEIRLLALGSSWIMLVFGTRTFSNTIEMLMCSLLLYFVADSMIKTNTAIYKKKFLEEKYNKATSISERVKIWKLKNALPPHNFYNLRKVTVLCVAGIFNRPTFLLFGAPMVFYWMLRGMGTKAITFIDFHLRMLVFCCSCLPTILLFTICDSIYYNYLTVGELQMLNLSIDNFVFTPWNFIKYNLDGHNTAVHGVHAKYLHVLVNIPLLFSILGMITLLSFLQLLSRFLRAEYHHLPRAQSIVGLMTLAIFVPLLGLSLINHQEARFLIPLTFPVILLHAPKLCTGWSAQYPFRSKHRLLQYLYIKHLCAKASSKYILNVWYFSNILLTVFYGFIHQAGVVPLTQYFEHSMKFKLPEQQYHLVTSHMYQVPLTLMNIPSTGITHLDRQNGKLYKRSKDFYLHEFGSLPLPHLLNKIKLIASQSELKLQRQQYSYRLFVSIPTALSDELNLAFEEKPYIQNYMEYKLLTVIYPHLSTEAMPDFYGRHPYWVDSAKCDKNDFQQVCHLRHEEVKRVERNNLSWANIMQQFSSFMHQFGLALYEFKVKSI